MLSDRDASVAVIVATGSEVQLAVEAQRRLDARGEPVRVVSMPSTSVFDRQPRPYRDSVLGQGLPRIAAEAGSTRPWAAYGCTLVLGLDRYGESAPGLALAEPFGFTAASLTDLVLGQLATARAGEVAAA